MKTIPSDLPPFERLRYVLRALRAPDGCPWDREQTLATIQPCLQEEAYELLQAMTSDSLKDHVEELGDVLLQILFQVEIREEESAFTWDDVVNTLTEKLIRRHPHVFGDVKAETTGQVLTNWEQIKQTEKTAPDHSALDGVPAALPALLKAQRTQGKAARVGFDWDNASGPDAKLDEEIAELREAIASGQQERIEDEMGDVLFTLTNLCRFIKVDAESALRKSTDKFATRFRAVEKRVHEQGKQMKDLTLAELDAIWDAVKAEQR